LDPGGGRLRQIIAYAKKVFGLDRIFATLRDSRQDPDIPTALVGRAVFTIGLLRIRSFNAFEPKLGEPWTQRLLGVPVAPGTKAFSVDAVSYALKRMDVASVRALAVQMVQKAERNKVFREGWYGALRFVAIDGWEVFSSYRRHCEACLTRQVKVGDQKVTQYYHVYVVALLVADKVEVVLDMEPIRSADVRREQGEKAVPGHEGEVTAAKRLARRLRTTYGRWLDVLLLDGLYGNGPFLTLAQELGFGVIAVLKKPTDEPLKEALALWEGEPPVKVVHDAEKHERIELWDCPEIQTLSSYRGPIRVVRGIVHREGESEPTTWCFAVTGKATPLSAERVVRAGRSRWHIENTGFDQWTRYWQFTHVFTHGARALPALMWLFFLAFNLLQLFVYRQIGGYGRDRGKDVTRTFLRLVDEMRDDLARLETPLAWDTS